MSLRTRLSVLSVAVLLALLLIGGTFQYFLLGAYLRQDEAKLLQRRVTAAVNADNLNLVRAGACGPTVVRAPKAAAGRITAARAQCIAGVVSGPLVAAAIFAPDGGIVASAPTDVPSPGLPVNDYLRAARGQGRTYYTTGSGSDESLVVLRPLRERAGGSVVGVLQLSESVQQVNATQQRLLTVLGLATAALTAIAVIVLPLLVGRALRPLRRVTEASSALARGELTRRVPTPKSQDELGSLAAAFNEMAENVQENEEQMRRFAGDASHELRTPLTTIQGHLDLLQRGAAQDPESQAKALASMQREVHRMAGLVQDLLTLTRLDAAAVDRPGAAELVDLDALVGETVEEQSVRAPMQRVYVIASGDGDAVVRGDREQLRRVVQNLADNALKYAPGGTHAWRTTVTESRVELSLSDQGPGIAEADLPHLFERFYRGQTAGEEAPGSGLGLAIVRSVVEAQGGAVQAVSGQGGTSITISLPRAPTTPAGGR